MPQGMPPVMLPGMPWEMLQVVLLEAPSRMLPTPSEWRRMVLLFVSMRVSQFPASQLPQRPQPAWWLQPIHKKTSKALIILGARNHLSNHDVIVKRIFPCFHGETM
jgi:hypothetical protein